jgi:Superinfection immunity protein
MIATVLTVDVICLMTAGSAALYLLPMLIGLARRIPDIGPLVAVNVLLGWTLAGWAVALAMALRPVRPAAAAVQVVQNFPLAVPYPPGPMAAAGWAGPPGPPPPRPGVPPPLALPPRPGGCPAGPAGHAEQH